MSQATARKGSRYEVPEGGKVGPLAQGQVVEVEVADKDGVIVTYYEAVTHVDNEGTLGIRNAPRNVRLTGAQFGKLTKTTKKANTEDGK